jgi:hypothetical protein
MKAFAASSSMPRKQSCMAFAKVNRLGTMTHKLMRAGAVRPAEAATWQGRNTRQNPTIRGTA